MPKQPLNLVDLTVVGGLVLLIDPEPVTREQVRVALGEDGYLVAVAAAPEEVDTLGYDVVIADIRVGVAETMALRRPGTEVVVITCPERLDEARAAIRQGAFDFVLRPFYVEDVSLTVACAAHRGRGRTLDNTLAFILKNHELAD
jgi:DNA-binding NtrC family response regulator